MALQIHNREKVLQEELCTASNFSNFLKSRIFTCKPVGTVDFKAFYFATHYWMNVWMWALSTYCCNDQSCERWTGTVFQRCNNFE